MSRKCLPVVVTLQSDQLLYLIFFLNFQLSNSRTFQTSAVVRHDTMFNVSINYLSKSSVIYLHARCVYTWDGRKCTLLTDFSFELNVSLIAKKCYFNTKMLTLYIVSIFTFILSNKTK